MSKTKWLWLTFDDHKVKPHALPASLYRPLLADIRGRNHDVAHKIKPVGPEGMSMDEPGMMAIDRPYEHFEIAGLSLQLPSEDCAAFLSRLRRMEPRHFAPAPIPYYKLHDWRCCLVLRPPHYTRLVIDLGTRLPLAEANALAFYAKRQPISEILREANARTAGVPLEQIPDCGEHRTDRFHPKDRGQA